MGRLASRRWQVMESRADANHRSLRAGRLDDVATGGPLQ